MQGIEENNEGSKNSLSIDVSTGPKIHSIAGMPVTMIFKEKIRVL
ncbi:hypothetical protein [Methanofollis sp. W23]|nr:hypothetical protein [Methanofollis sp. W23]